MLYCERCEKETRKPVWLELSATDGNYYAELPVGHESQGGFPFGPDCAAKLRKSIQTKTGPQQ